jgi:predicted nucleic acid-binding Zn finger protein
MTDEDTSERDEMKRRFSQYSRYGRKFDKAIETVLSRGVKESRFSPSGRRLLTVVGVLGEEFIDPEKPYCSCSNFHFRVMTGKEGTCYHLLSFAIASKAQKVDVISFDDEEFGPLTRAVFNDVYTVMNSG